MSNIVYPYKLSVTIVKGENLVIQDLFSSDPYVIVELGGQEIGRTSIIFQNRSHPQWNETITLNLLHLHSGFLHFRIFDYDEGKEDDFMGDFIVDLSRVKPGRPLELAEKVGNICDKSDMTARGILHITIFLEKNENIFTLLPYKEAIPLSEASALIVNQVLDKVNATVPESVVLTQIAAELEKFSLLSKEYLRDLLFDVRNLDEAKFDAVPMTLAKKQRGFVNSMAYSVLSKKYQLTAPMKGYSIKITTATGETLLLSFGNRYLMWRWVRCLLTSLSMIDGEQLNVDKYRSFFLSNHAKINERAAGLMQLSSDHVSVSPKAVHELKYETRGSLHTLDLHNVVELQFSQDAPVASEFYIDMRITALTTIQQSSSHNPDIRYYVVMRADTEMVSTSQEPFPEPKWSQHIGFDATYAELPSDTKGVHLFLFCKPAGAGQKPYLVTEQFISMKTLLGLRSKFMSEELTPPDGESIKTTHTMNLTTALVVIVKQVLNLPLIKSSSASSSFGRSTAPSTEREIFMKCSYFASSALALSKGETVFKETKSGVVKSGDTDVAFSSMEFKLPSEDGLFNADYVRIRVYSGSQVKPELLGDVYIPLRDFQRRDAEIRYHLELNETSLAEAGKGSSTLVVALARDAQLNSSQYSIQLDTRCWRSNQFKTLWHAECVPASMFSFDEDEVSEDDVTKSVEIYNLCPTYKHLVLSEPQKSIADNKAIDDESISKSFASHLFSFDITGEPSIRAFEDIAEGDDGLTIFAFENERRGTMPPFNFGTAHLNKTDPSRFSDESGSRSFDFESEPPVGHIWEGKWLIDLIDGQTDADGWSYASNFGALRVNFRTHHSHHDSSVTYFVRRRRWKRKAIVNATKRSSVLMMNTKVINPATVHHEFREDADHDYVLKACRERESSTSPIRIPWNKVITVSVCSPSVLLVLVEVGRFHEMNHKTPIFEEARVEIFVTNCCAANLKTLIQERMELAPIRKKISEVVQYGGMTPIAKIKDGSTRSKELEKNKHELSIGSEVLQVIADKLSELTAPDNPDSRRPSVELRTALPQVAVTNASPVLGAVFRRPSIEKMDRPKPLSRSQSTSSLGSGALMKISRLKLYMASLCGNALHIDHDFVPQKVQEMIAIDIAKIDVSDSVTALKSQLKELITVSSARIRDAALAGWSHRGEEFKKCLIILVREYFTAIVSAFGNILDPVNMGNLKGVGPKLEFSALFLSSYDCIDRLLHETLRPYGLFVKPSVKLTLCFDVSKVLGIFEREIRKDVDEAFQKMMTGWRTKASRFRHPLPWPPVRPANDSSGPYQSTIPEELRTQLLDLLDHFKDLNEYPAEHRQDMHLFHRRLELVYVRTFNHLVSVYESAIDSTAWSDTSHETEPAIIKTLLEERSIWLCSVINDCYRMKQDSHVSFAKPEVNFHGEPDVAYKRVIEVTRSVYANIETLKQLALDSLASLVFAHSAGLFDNFTARWQESVSAAGVAGPVTDIMYSIKETLHFYRYMITNLAYYTRLVEMCADKIVVFYLSFIRDRKSPLSRPEIVRMENDIKAINRAFVQCFQGVDSEKNFALVELRLKRILDLYYLLADLPHAERYVNTTRKIIGESECTPVDASSLSELLNCTLTLREWNEDIISHKEPLEQLVSIIKSHEKEAVTPGEKRLYEYSTVERVFQMKHIPAATQLFRSSLLAPAVGASITDTGVHAEIGLLLKKVYVSNLKVSSLFSLSSGLIVASTKVYIVLTIGKSEIKTEVKNSLNPSWEDDVYEFEFETRNALIENTKIVCQIYYGSTLGIGGDTLFARCEVPLDVTDDLMGLTGRVEMNVEYGDSKAVKVAHGHAVKKGAEMPRLQLSFQLKDD